MKNIVLNNAMIEFSSSQITTLFKPSNNPKTDDEAYVALSVGATPTNHFGLQYYPKDAATATTAVNPNATKYNTKNIITNLFLVTETFIKFMGQLNKVWEADNFPRTLTTVSYIKDSTGSMVIDPANPSYTLDAAGKAAGKTSIDLVSVFSGPSSNQSEPIAQWESYAKLGIYAKGGGATSLVIPELILRHLYSIDPDKRSVAFEVAKNYYGIDASLCDAEEKEMIPSEDFDSDLLNISIADGDVTIEYPKPFKLQKKFINSIDNPSDEKLYWYFPLISGNTLNGLHTGMVRAKPKTVQSVDSMEGKTQAYTPKGSATSVSDLTEYPDNASLCSTLWDVAAEKSVIQAGYTVLEISEAGNGGDLIYDHTNEIDYVASWTMVIKGTSVFS